MKRVALVTGAGRGLGWGTAMALARKDFHLGLMGRDPVKLKERKREIEQAGGRASVFGLDLEKPASISAAVLEVRGAFPDGLQLLVNNAGVCLDINGAYDTALASRSLQINALGPLQLTMGLAPLLMKGRANIVNVSSGMGGLTEMGGRFPGYRISKTALNAATRYLSQEWQGKGVRVNSVCAGWVRTDMGGANAECSLEEGVESILWAALLPEDGPNGGFYRDGKAVPW